MMNFKQRELIEILINQIMEKFPEVELIDVSESWEDPETLWIHVTDPENESRRLELIECLQATIQLIFSWIMLSYAGYADSKESRIDFEGFIS